MKVLLTVSVLTVAGIIFVGNFALAEKTYRIGDKTVTKVEALKTLINDPKADVVQCSSVELTENATMKNKKVVKK